MITSNEWRGIWYRLTHQRIREGLEMLQWLIEDYGLFWTVSPETRERNFRRRNNIK
jgi:hypothetical protein